MGKRPTAVYCQYWMMLLFLLTVASSLLFPFLLTAASFPLRHMDVSGAETQCDAAVRKKTLV